MDTKEVIIRLETGIEEVFNKVINDHEHGPTTKNNPDGLPSRIFREFPEEAVREHCRRYHDARDEWWSEPPYDRKVLGYNFGELIADLKHLWEGTGEPECPYCHRKINAKGDDCPCWCHSGIGGCECGYKGSDHKKHRKQHFPEESKGGGEGTDTMSYRKCGHNINSSVVSDEQMNCKHDYPLFEKGGWNPPPDGMDMIEEHGPVIHNELKHPFSHACVKGGCPMCGGSGGVMPHKMLSFADPCSDCNGTGERRGKERRGTRVEFDYSRRAQRRKDSM